MKSEKRWQIRRISELTALIFNLFSLPWEVLGGAKLFSNYHSNPSTDMKTLAASRASFSARTEAAASKEDADSF